MSRKAPIVVAGAGIAGLTTALALLRRGLDVEVYEQAPVLKGLGAGVQLAANASRVLRHLGLGAAMEVVAVQAEAKEIRLWNTGEAWSRPMQEEPPYWFVHRGDLHELLVQAVEAGKPGCIHLGATAVDYEGTADGATLILADGRRIDAAVLVAADGVHSPLRRRMHGAETDVRFTGLAAWRGLVPMDRLPDEFRRPVGGNWQGVGSHIITYPVRGGTLLNFVGVVEDGTWRDESWTSEGDVASCLADFEGWHPHIRAVIENVATPYKWALLSRPPLSRWVDGRVCLIGDAAHPTLPFMAQGACMAIEDGMILARCLEADEAGPALARFTAARMKRTVQVVTMSDANTRRFHNPVLGDPVEARAYLDKQWAPDAVGARYDWLFDYDAVRAPL